MNRVWKACCATWRAMDPSSVWAQGWPISRATQVPGDLQELPPPVQVHTGHSHLRMLSWKCASPPTPTPVQENSLQGRADSSGQGSSMCQKWFSSFDSFTKVFQKLEQLSAPQLTWKASFTNACSVCISLLTYFSISILKNGCPLHPMFLTWKWKKRIHFFLIYKVATQGRSTSSDWDVSASRNLLDNKRTHHPSLVSLVIRGRPKWSETGQDELRRGVAFGGRGVESGPLLALATALVLGIINSEFPSPYWNLYVVENELHFTGLRETAMKLWRSFVVSQAGTLSCYLM